MAESTAIAVALVVALPGCDGGDDDDQARGGPPPRIGLQGEPARPGDAPTDPPAPVEGDEDRPPRPTVIASGYTARGDPFELVLYGTSRGPCIQTLYPARRSSEGGGACGETIIPKLRAPISAAGSSSSGREHQVLGFVSEEVDSVRLSFDAEGESQVLDAVTEQVPGRLLDHAGAPEPVGIFVAFLPRGVEPADVGATAFSATGAVLGSTRWPTLDE